MEGDICETRFSFRPSFSRVYVDDIVLSAVERVPRVERKAMAKRHIRDAEYCNDHTRILPALSIGDPVLIQNQTGNHPKRWEKTDRIVEALDNRQYGIKVDGSNRITLQNCRFLRKISPVAASPPALPLPPYPDNWRPIP